MPEATLKVNGSTDLSLLAAWLNSQRSFAAFPQVIALLAGDKVCPAAVGILTAEIGERLRKCEIKPEDLVFD